MSVVRKCGHSESYRPVRRAGSVVAVSLLALLAVGCRDEVPRDPILGWTVSDPSQNHPILVSQTPVFLEIEVPRGSSGITPAQRSMVHGFFAHYRSSGEGRVTISAPSGSRNEGAVMHALPTIREVAHSQGIADHIIDMEPYYAEGNGDAPLKISYLEYTAKAPDCGMWPGNLADNDRNHNYHNFGCAQQKNLAAIVANPKDLLGPQEMDPRSSERGYVHWGKYVKGDSTGAQKSEDEKSGNISEVGQN